MTKEERTKQIKRRVFWCAWGVFCVACWWPVGTKYFAMPVTPEINVTAGASSLLGDVLNTPSVEADDVEVVEVANECEVVEATAYYDVNHVGKVHGYTLCEGITLAGKEEWRGRWVNLYRCNKDGSKGELMGLYQFQDVGYGKNTGKGQSKLLKGRCLGDIETGQTIDIYFDNYMKCSSWGRRKVYMEWVDES